MLFSEIVTLIQKTQSTTPFIDVIAAVIPALNIKVMKHSNRNRRWTSWRSERVTQSFIRKRDIGEEKVDESVDQGELSRSKSDSMRQLIFKVIKVKKEAM